MNQLDGEVKKTINDNVTSPIFPYYIMMADISRKYFDKLSSRQDVKNGYKQEYVNKYM